MTLLAYDTSGRLETLTNADSSTRTFTWSTADQLLTETDELGRTTSYEWDDLDRLVQITLADPDGTGPLAAPVIAMAWDAASRLTSRTDPAGNVTSYGYSQRDWLTSITLPDPDGAGPLASPVLGRGYNAAGSLTSETDALGNVTSYGHDNAQRLTSVTLADPDGAGSQTSPVTTFTLDALGRTTKVRDPLGRDTLLEYDGRNRLTKRTQADPDGAGSQTSPVTQWAFDNAGQLTSQTDALGRVTSWQYDLNGRVTKITLPDPDGAGALTAPEYLTGYDALGNVLTETDPLGNVTAYDYDGRSRVTKITLADPDGAGSLTSPVIHYVWDAASQLTSETDALGGVTSWQYDNLGRVTKTVLPDPDGAGSLTAPEYTTSYDSRGNVTSESDALGNTTSYVYDDLSRLTTITEADPDGAGPLTSPVTALAYDAASRVTSRTDPLGRTTAWSYDNLGRRTKTVLPDPDGTGSLTAPEYTTTYDKVGNVLTEVDPLGNTTSFEHDGLNRLVKRTEADPDGAGPLGNPITRWVYDAVGNLTGLTDAETNQTVWVYDGLDRATTETDPHGKARTYVYDAASNLTKLTDRNGRIIEYVYDNLYRQTQEVWKDASNNTVNTITSTYDAASQLTSIADSFSAYAYVHDGLGRVTEVDNAGTPGVPNVVLTSAYDANGNRTQLAATVNSTADFTNTYQYDALNRMTRLTQADGSPSTGLPISEKRVDLSYNAAGQFDTITRYADLAGTDLVATSSYLYDGIGRLTDLTHTKGANTLADYSYTFDAASRITTVTSNDGTTSYSYDATSQLTAADHSYQTDESYTYNYTGGRTDSDNVHVAANRLVDDGTYTYQYDDEGNRTRRTEKATGDYIAYTWDHRNRLVAVEFRTSAEVMTKAVEYKYDVFDGLISRRVDETGDGVFDQAQKFVYDGLETVLVYDDSGSLENRYLYGPELDQLFAGEDVLGDVLWTLTDHQGTVRDLVEYDAVTDTTSVVNHIEYDSFGNITAQSNPNDQPLFAFTGRFLDADTGLQWHNARWYEPPAGLWLSPDPIGILASGDTNLYRYVGNNPVNLIDPLGLTGQPAPGWPGSELPDGRPDPSKFYTMDAFVMAHHVWYSGQMSAEMSQIREYQAPQIDPAIIADEMSEIGELDRLVGDALGLGRGDWRQPADPIPAEAFEEQMQSALGQEKRLMELQAGLIEAAQEFGKFAAKQGAKHGADIALGIGMAVLAERLVLSRRQVRGLIIALGLTAWLTVRSQQVAAERLRSVGARVEMHRGPKWLEEIWEDDLALYEEVHSVRFPRDAADEDLRLVSGLAGLERLSIGGAEITDAGLRHVRGLSRLKWLWVVDANITGEGLIHLRDSTKLEDLYLCDTRLNDEGLRSLVGLENLKSLNVWNTDISDEGLKHVASLKSLQSLSLEGTRITSDGLKHLAGLERLRLPSLGGTRLSKREIEDVRAERPLTPDQQRAALMELAAVVAAEIARAEESLTTDVGGAESGGPDPLQLDAEARAVSLEFWNAALAGDMDRAMELVAVPYAGGELDKGILYHDPGEAERDIMRVVSHLQRLGGLRPAVAGIGPYEDIRRLMNAHDRGQLDPVMGETDQVLKLRIERADGGRAGESVVLVRFGSGQPKIAGALSIDPVE